jgi:hypothetical protein
MVEDDAIRLTQYPDKTLIFNAYELDPTIHKRTLADHVIGCSYEYVRRLFAELDTGEFDEDQIADHLAEAVQRELARRLLAQGLTLDADLDIDLEDIEVAPIPPAKLDEYLVPAVAVSDVREALADTRDLMDSMDETAGKAVASMAIEKLDGVLREARAE